ncbi:MAG TPA: c-type cytochrome biogenesis protein CcmI [Pseudolabrys sp.]|nr:c-type cytochrome biogenesis protein CcmI [Pseudolabrys sp.]
MLLWSVFAVMTAVAILSVLWPLSRTANGQAGSDVAVYRDQLDEVDRDRKAGLIGEAEAQAARVEVSRRLIAAADRTEFDHSPSVGSSLWRRRAAAVAAVVVLPLVAAALYLANGSPQLPGQPLEARLRAVHQDTSIAVLISQAEAHLERNPNDARGYEVLAPVYLRVGRFSDAVNARRKLITLSGENAERQSDLGEALVAAANGIVTADAKSAFERALVLEPGELKAKFYIGIAAEQDGDRGKAAAIWSQMIDKAPAGAPWLPMVRDALTRVGAAPPKAAAPAAATGPSVEDVAAAGTMSEKDRDEMVRGMVARLANRLRENGSDVEGWQRLLRAYVVLGERDKAHEAAADAKRALASDPDKLRKIEEMLKSLGLEG